MVLWDVQYINFRLTQTSGFNTLQAPSVYKKKASHNESPKALAGAASDPTRVCRERRTQSDKLLSLQELRF